MTYRSGGQQFVRSFLTQEGELDLDRPGHFTEEEVERIWPTLILKNLVEIKLETVPYFVKEKSDGKES